MRFYLEAGLLRDQQHMQHGLPVWRYRLQQPVVLIFIDSDHGGNKAGALFFHQISLCQKSQFFFGKRVIAPQQPKQQSGGGSSWPVDCAPR